MLIGFVKNSLMTTMKKLEIIVTYLANLEVQCIGFVTFVNLQLTKKVPVIFHNIRGYDSHLIFCEFSL